LDCDEKNNFEKKKGGARGAVTAYFEKKQTGAKVKYGWFQDSFRAAVVIDRQAGQARRTFRFFLSAA